VSFCLQQEQRHCSAPPPAHTLSFPKTRQFLFFFLSIRGCFLVSDKTKFVVVEVSSNAAAPAAHKDTARYAA
jgi:hypothetical protein